MLWLSQNSMDISWRSTEMVKRHVATKRPGVGGAPKGTIPWNKGKSRQVTWGEAISRSTSGVKKSEEHKKKISRALLGRKLSEETKQSISVAATGRLSPHKGKRKATHSEVSWGVSGEKHWNWKGGISSENARFRASSAYKSWRDAVFLRDHWTCQFCGKRGGDLEADHILLFSTHPELRLDVANGRTLCRLCHKERTWKAKSLCEM